MAQLFYIYIGGSIQGASVELHDVRFVAGEHIEDTYDTLRTHWWGTPESLHLDCWGALTYADGHKITLTQLAPTQDKQLYFVNLGGYDESKFTELHKNVFVVAQNPAEAKTRALKKAQDWHLKHQDNQYAVEQILLVNDFVQKQGFHVRLDASDKEDPFIFTCNYVPIGEIAQAL